MRRALSPAGSATRRRRCAPMRSRRWARGCATRNAPNRRSTIRPSRMLARAFSVTLVAALPAFAQEDPKFPPDRKPDAEVAPRRPGSSVPERYFPPPVDPSQVPAPAAVLPRETLPVPDRWRIMQALGLKTPWFDPYNQNLLKGDLPLAGEWFANLGAVSDTLFEARRLPTPVGAPATRRPGSLAVFGYGKQSTFAQTLVVSASLIKGDTTFRPPDYELRIVPAFDVNRSQVEEVRALRVDPREGRTRNDNHVGLQEAFADMHLRNVSARYDFDSVRVCIQPCR